MPNFLARGKYYTRIRWGNDKTFRGDVKFPLATDDKLVAEHRRDKIQDTSLRGKIISAYEKERSDGVEKIKKQIFVSLVENVILVIRLLMITTWML